MSQPTYPGGPGSFEHLQSLGFPEVSSEEACAGTDTEKRFTPASLIEHLEKDGRGAVIIGATPGDFSHLSSPMFAGTNEESKVISGTIVGSFDELKAISEVINQDPRNYHELVSGIGVSSGLLTTGCDVFNTTVAVDHQFSDGNVTSSHIVNGPPMVVDTGIVDGENGQFIFLPTNFEMCAEINHLVGNITQRTQTTMAHQKKIIEGEWEEMCDHVTSGNIELLRNDIADMLFTVYGMAARLGIPADADFKKVCESQFTKFDNTEIDACKTRDKYLEKGITTYYDEQTRQDGSKVYVTYSAIDQTGKDNKPYPAGMWLKSCNFQEPIFDPLGE